MLRTEKDIMFLPIITCARDIVRGEGGVLLSLGCGVSKGTYPVFTQGSNKPMNGEVDECDKRSIPATPTTSFSKQNLPGTVRAKTFKKKKTVYSFYSGGTGRLLCIVHNSCEKNRENRVLQLIKYKIIT